MMKALTKIMTTPEEFLKNNLEEDGSIGGKLTKIIHADFQKVVKELLRPMHRQYIVDESNQELYWTIICYFARDKKFFDSPLLLNKEHASFDKGLLIAGMPGGGKTLMFRVFEKLGELIALTNNRFAVVYSQEVVDSFNVDGHKNIQNFNRGQKYFDDIGAESVGSNFGKEEIFRIILETRHRLFVDKGTKTFFTTNFDLDAIESRYGKRVESRVHEMFNLIFAKSIDFRKNK